MDAWDGMCFMLVALCLSGMQSHFKISKLKKRLDDLESRLGLKTTKDD